jgi:hypothetical protein
MDDMLTIEQLGPEIEGTLPGPGPAVQPVVEPVAGVVAQVQSVAAQPVIAAEPPPVFAPIAPPLAEEPANDGLPPQLLTVFLRPSGDPDRDRRRIKNVYGILISHPGKDRFQFQIFENSKGHLIDFPNDTTRIGAEMLERLKKLMGGEEWRVEEITYQ